MNPARVRLVTRYGDILIDVFPAQAPITADAFLQAIDAGAFGDVAFARTVGPHNDQGHPPISILQASPTSRMPDERVPHEPTGRTGLRHRDGTLSLARIEPGAAVPNIFFICIGDQPALDEGGARQADGLGFAAFGQVAEGMDVVRRIAALPTKADAPDPYLLGQVLQEPAPIVRAYREPVSQPDRFAALAGDYWELRKLESPTEASNAGDHRWDDRLDAADLASHQRRAELWSGLLKRALEIDGAALGADTSDSLALLIDELRFAIDLTHYGEHLLPRLYPFTFASVASDLASMTPLQTLEDYRRFVARLEAIPRYIDENLETLRSGRQAGYRLAEALVPRARGLAAAQLEAQSGSRARVLDRFARMPAGVDAQDFAALRTRAAEIVDDKVLPAVSRIIQFIDEASETTCGSVSVCHQPHGSEYYLCKVRQQTGMTMHPEEIFEIGVEETRAIQTRIEKVAHEQGFASGRDYCAHLDKVCAVSGEDLLRRTRALSKIIDPLMPDLFGVLPRITYGVHQLGAQQSVHSPPAFAQPGGADRRSPGIFWITALPDRCPLHLLTALTLHEAWPGHLMQIALAYEQEQLPEFRRYGWANYNAYIEGWALYCERLGHDFGLYESPADAVGQLGFDLWRSVRLVVDTGLHWKRWSREQAIAYMVENTFMPRDTIESEVDRYIGMPAQALSYKIGERSLRALRREAEERLGARLSLRAFHDEILSLGPVNLGVLNRRMREWISGEAARVETAA